MHFRPAMKKRELCTRSSSPPRARLAEYLLDWYGDPTAPDFVEPDARRGREHSYLPNDLLVKVDIATMAHGLEGRSPMLDHELHGVRRQPAVVFKLRGIRDEVHPETVAAPLLPAEYRRGRRRASACRSTTGSGDRCATAPGRAVQPRRAGRGYFDPGGTCGGSSTST